MSSTQVTGGTVSVEDGLKSAVEYQPPRKVRVDLNFSVAEGDDANDWLTRVGDLAFGHVARLLGTTAVIAPAAPAAGEPSAPRTRRTAAPKSPDTSSGSQGSGDAGNAAGAPPSGDGGAPSTSGAPADPATPPPSDDDEWGSGAATETVTEVSDADLNTACSSAAERVGDPTKVRDAIQAFNTKAAGERFKVTEIPQAQRKAFLDKLAGLSK